MNFIKIFKVNIRRNKKKGEILDYLLIVLYK
jgi:hypothetical protein